MVSKDPIEKIEDLILGQSKDITYSTVCKKLKPIEYYEKELKNVRKKISEVALDAQPSLEKLLDRMKKLDYSLISEDIKREYGNLICSLTETFYYGMLKGIDLTVHDNIYIFKNSELERRVNIQERINNLKTSLDYLASGDIIERFFKAYLKKVEDEFHDAGYRISDLLRIRGIRGIRYLLNNPETVADSFNTLAELVAEESERVSYVVKDLASDPELNKEDLDKYIGHK